MTEKETIKKVEKKEELIRFDIYGELIEAKNIEEAIEKYNKK